MPAPRSILIDIHDRGLNPNVAHKSVDANGRIKASVEVSPEQKPEPGARAKKTQAKHVKQTEAEPKAEVADKAPTTASGEAAVAEVTNEGAGSVEHKQQEEAVLETPATASRGRGKRVPPSNA